MSERPAAAELEDRRLGPHAVALLGERGGKYPDANALLVRGADRTVLVDAPLGVLRRVEQGRLPPIDAVILSHCHEDHLPALSALREVALWVHAADRPGLESLDAFLDVFGYPEADRAGWAREVVERFRFVPRSDARWFEDGHRWELGGEVALTAVHAPGHTRGHCVFRVEPDDVLFLADLDLSSFGPYYADAWSDLDDLERTLERAKEWRARRYLSGHHVGVIEDDATYLERLGRYREKVSSRERELLGFLSEPRTLEQIAARRFVYRPHDVTSGIERTERATARRHLERLERTGRVERLAGGRWVAA